MKTTLEARLGMFFALAMCVAVVLIETFGGANFFRRGYQVTSNFQMVHQLNVGDPVKLAGVRVGSVSGIELTNNQVAVSMKIDDGRRIRANSVAQIKFAGLMGQNFVELDFGTPDGALIDPAVGGSLRSLEQPDINILMARLEGVAKGVEDMTKSFGGDSIENILTPMGDFMRENNPKFNAIFGNVQLASDKIVTGNGTIGKMVFDELLYDEAVIALSKASDSSRKLNGMLTDMSSLLGSAKRTMSRVDSGRSTMGLLVKDEALYRETTTAMINLKEVLEKINGTDGAIGQLVNEADFLSALTLTLQKVEKATDSLEDQGPLSIIGLVFGRFVKFTL